MNWKISSSSGFTPLEKLDPEVEHCKSLDLLRGGDENDFLTGFTLLELLIVMALISLLTGIGALTYTSAQTSGRDSKRLADLKRLQSALELYYADNHTYPGLTECSGWDNTDSLESFLVPPGGGVRYTEDIPKDPKDPPYKYCASECDSGKCFCYCLSAKMEKPENGNAAEGDCSHCDPTAGPDDEYNYTITCP